MADPGSEHEVRPASKRRTFGPVVALGLASGALGAWAGSKPWVDGIGRRVRARHGLRRAGA